MMRRALSIIFLIFSMLVPSSGQTIVINPYRFNTFVGVLDAYESNLRAAWSVSRRLRGGYTGPLIRVRSTAGGSPESDINPGADGWLDESALATFVGSDSAYVTTIYDQSGGGYHMAQTTTSAQMRIVDAGTIDKLASKPCLYHSGANNTMGYFSSEWTSYTGTTLSAVGRGLLGNVANGRFIGVSSSTNNDYDSTARMALAYQTAAGTYWGTYSSSVVGSSAWVGGSTNTDTLISVITDATNTTKRIGSNSDAGAHTAAFSVTRGLWGMVSTAAPFAASGSKFAEFILWTSDQTSNDTAIRAALAY